MRLKRLAGSIILFLVVTVVTSPIVAQPLRSGSGPTDVAVVLRQLNSVGTFMMFTAHPDDENNSLLAKLAKGQGHRTVLLTATRGDGGQNEIGAELFDGLAANHEIRMVPGEFQRIERHQRVGHGRKNST